MITKKLTRVAVITFMILLAPLIAKLTVEGFNWSAFDFFAMGTIIFIAGSAFELISSKFTNLSYKAAVGLAILSCFMLFWVTGAVGIIGSEDNPANLMYLGVIVIGLLGAAISKLQPKGLSNTLFAMTFVQLLIPVIALIIGSEFQDVPEAVGVAGVMFLNAGFAFIMALSGILFRNSEPQSHAQQLN